MKEKLEIEIFDRYLSLWVALCMVAFAPIVALLLGIGGIQIPWATLKLSITLFVVIPLILGVITRHLIVKNKGLDYLENIFIPKFKSVTIIGLLLTLVIIFSFQGNVILNNPLHIGLIAAPAGMIGASNFFELAVAVAITLYGVNSPVALATIVGVLVKVPVMLMLVRFANKTKGWFVNE